LPKWSSEEPSLPGEGYHLSTFDTTTIILSYTSSFKHRFWLVWRLIVWFTFQGDMHVALRLQNCSYEVTDASDSDSGAEEDCDAGRCAEAGADGG
ncbi:MAG: hypothetical protein ACYS8Z_01760, partial [Planctomycetota bacterium]